MAWATSFSSYYPLLLSISVIPTIHPHLHSLSTRSPFSSSYRLIQLLMPTIIFQIFPTPNPPIPNSHHLFSHPTHSKPYDSSLLFRNTPGNRPWGRAVYCSVPKSPKNIGMGKSVRKQRNPGQGAGEKREEGKNVSRGETFMLKISNLELKRG